MCALAEAHLVLVFEVDVGGQKVEHDVNQKHRIHAPETYTCQCVRWSLKCYLAPDLNIPVQKQAGDKNTSSPKELSEKRLGDVNVTL
jgi:hypothetical protein